MAKIAFFYVVGRGMKKKIFNIVKNITFCWIEN